MPRTSRFVLAVSCTLSCALLAGPAPAQETRPPNAILFVPDALRALTVTAETAPAMATLRDQGVNVTNPHSLFPTCTPANAARFATSHDGGDNGDFSNTIYTGYPTRVPDAPPTV